MHCGVMVTGYNQGDWERLLAQDYDRLTLEQWIDLCA